MSLNKADKAQLVEKFGKSATNTGSPEVQIALLTSKLNYLNEHFKENKKDFHSKQGLLQMVGQRRNLLSYLQKKDMSRYKTLIAELGIRK